MEKVTYLRLRPRHGEKSDHEALEIVRIDEADESGLHQGRLELRLRYVLGPKLRDFGWRTTTFGGSYQLVPSRDYPNGTARLTNGGFFIDPPALRGRGIGTYVMNRIVGWAKQHAPNAEVGMIKWNTLQALQADDGTPDIENMARRTKVYENFGLRFAKREERGIPDSAGHSLAICVADLQVISADRLLQEIDIEKLLAETTERAKNLDHDLQQARRANLSLRDSLDRMHRWTRRWMFAAISLFVIIILVKFLVFARS